MISTERQTSRAPRLPWSAGVRAFVRDVSATAMTRALGVVTGVATLTVTTRLLGPEGRGEFAVAMAVLGLVLQFCTMGLHASATYHLSRHAQDRESVTAWLAVHSLVGVGFVSLATVALVQAMPWLVPNVRLQLLALALLTAPPAMFVLLASNAALGLGSATRYNGLDLATKAIGLVSVLLLFLWPLSAFFLSYALGHYLLAAWAYRWLAGWKSTRPKAAVARLLYAYGVRVFLVNLFMFLVLRQDLFMVNAWLGASAAGHYSVAVQVAELLSLATGSISAILFPRLAPMADDRRWAVTWRAFRWTGGLLAVAACALAIVGRPVFRIAFGEAYLSAVRPFWILLPGLWCLGVNSILLQHLAARGTPWPVIATTAGAATFNVALTIALIRAAGMEGAAAASTATYFVILVSTLAVLLADRRRELAARYRNA